MNEPDPVEIWGKVEAWLHVAESDRLAAQRRVEGDRPLRDVAAFHCPQAAEKLLKGFLVRASSDFGKTHDLVRLGHPVSARFPEVASLIEPMQVWTTWNIACRYPDEAEPEPEPSVAELSSALEAIDRLASVLRELAPRDASDNGRAGPGSPPGSSMSRGA
jgi:HEPN domain-containing protein